MSPAQATERGFLLVNWLAEKLNGLPVEATQRVQLSAACLSIAQDHHAGVIVLLERELFASAVALVRPQYEAYVNGIWLAHCASEQQLLHFANGGSLPKMYALLDALKNVDSYQYGHLSDIKASSWSAMCSFTHTGSLQVGCWLTDRAIEPSYPDEDLVETANFTGAIALLSGVGLAALANQSALTQDLLARARDHAKNEF